MTGTVHPAVSRSDLRPLSPETVSEIEPGGQRYIIEAVLPV